MAKRTGPTSTEIKKLIADLRSLSTKENVKIWDRIADEISKPTRKRREATIQKVNKYTREGETAIVPGKLLSEGSLTKKLTIAALKFSEKAKEEANKKGNLISIQQLMKENPKGKKVRIIG